MSPRIVIACISSFIALSVCGQSMKETLSALDTVKNPNERLLLLNQVNLDQNYSDSLFGEYLLNFGISYGMLGSADSAQGYFHKLIEVAGDGQHYQLARAYNGLGNVQRRAGQNQESLDNFLKALNILQDKKDTPSVRFEASIINNLSGIYFDMGQLDKAREFTERSIARAKELDDGDQLAYSYVGLALIADNEGKWEEAILAHKEAAKYIDEHHVDYLRGFNKLNLAEIYERQNQLQNAEKTYKELIVDPTVNIEVNLSALANLSKMQNQAGHTKEAIGLASQLLAEATERKMISHIRDAHHLLYTAYQIQGDYRRALAAHEDYMVYKDSLVNTEAINALNELEKKYETEKKEREIETLALKNEQNELQLEKQASERMLYLVAIVTLLIVVGLVLWQFSQKSKFNRILTDKNGTISKALHEREVLLKEIHHRVKNNLQIISSLLNLQARFIKDKSAIDAVQEGRNRVKSMALIHQKLYQQENIEGINMPEYIDNLTRALLTSYKIKDERITVDKNVASINLDIDTAIPLGLILNELLTNSLKYAFPENEKGALKISLLQEAETLMLEVADNGVGMDSSRKSEGSFGMTLIDSLAEKLNATVESVQENGTRFLIRISNYKLA
ncbi:histidine kinase dimerization/phosphoacceptor domain -containing protein [Marinoscillum sp.]|uniref:histidine kinase dimerization/phosphoacceptor domain -containing protein n=1 Tax=Marinoscillum sp. TaxID=2024838 RepID=UPI003BAA6771